MRVQVHANTRIRRLYFTDTLHTDEDLPNEFKLFGPASTQKKKPVEAKVAKEQVAKDQAHPVTPKTVQDKEEEIPPPPTPTDEEVLQKTDLPAEENVPEIKEQIPEVEQVDMQEVGEETKAAEEVLEEAAAAGPAAETEEAVGEVPIEAETAGDSQAVETAEGEAVAEVHVGGTEEATENVEEEPKAAEPTETPAAEEEVVQVVEEPAKADEEPLPTIEEAEVGGATTVTTTTELDNTEEPTATESPTETGNESPEE